MDKKRTQRILGILVIIALVIILFPLISGKNDLTNNLQTSIKSSPPAYNEPQPEQTALADDAFLAQVPETPPEPTINNENSNTADTLPAPAMSNTLAPDNDASNEMAPAVLMEDDTPPATQTEAIKIVEPSDTQSIKLMEAERVKQNENSIVVIKDTANAEKTATIEPPVHKVVKKVAAQKHPTVHAKHSKFSQPAWVIQLGSFKNKANARHLTDTLRAAGYKAFVQEVKSPSGKTRTRVYIGPEYQQASAISLSAKIQKELMLQGIVVSYKPLVL